jgi:CheY-like chemotaxis protein
MSFRILHVDDDPNARRIVELIFTVDPTFTVRSCASGKDALETAANWASDLILSDVMMPGMDGPTMLACLREIPKTAQIPVVFMTARAQTHDLAYFKSLGAAGVIVKPFDPMTLSDLVRGHLGLVERDTVDDDFSQRLQSDAITLGKYQVALRGDPTSSIVLEELQLCAHKLAGAAGVFGFQAVSRAASALEDCVIDRHGGRGTPGAIEANLDALLDRLTACNRNASVMTNVLSLASRYRQGFRQN